MKSCQTCLHLEWRLSGDGTLKIGVCMAGHRTNARWCKDYMRDPLKLHKREMRITFKVREDK